MFLVWFGGETDQVSSFGQVQKMDARDKEDVAEGQTGEWVGRSTFCTQAFGERNVKAILEFLEGTKVGKMPSRVLLAGGPDLEEEELEGFSLQALGEEEIETEVSSSEDEDGPGPST